jgi:16S rRNA (guanine966-N2)-methyltransferase
MMRIISGTHKGRRIQPPKNLPVRPTTDRAKESLFNILMHQYPLEEATVLDLFAGTGSISYEFASRGAQQVVSVDQNASCVKFITKTTEEFALPITVVRASVPHFLERISNTYNFIFADPPYAYSIEAYHTLLDRLFSKSVLEKDGLLIVEHAEQINLSEMAHYKESRSYGGCVFSFFAY